MPGACNSYTITIVAPPSGGVDDLPGAGVGEVTQAAALQTGFWPPEPGEVLPYDVGRPPTYDADLVWDENEWKSIDGVFASAGGGRYHQQLVVVGKDCIYFEEVT